MIFTKNTSCFSGSRQDVRWLNMARLYISTLCMYEGYTARKSPSSRSTPHTIYTTQLPTSSIQPRQTAKMDHLITW